MSTVIRVCSSHDVYFLRKPKKFIDLCKSFKTMHRLAIDLVNFIQR
jgi:hypothetical protein